MNSTITSKPEKMYYVCPCERRLGNGQYCKKYYTDIRSVHVPRDTVQLVKVDPSEIERVILLNKRRRDEYRQLIQEEEKRARAALLARIEEQKQEEPPTTTSSTFFLLSLIPF